MNWTDAAVDAHVEHLLAILEADTTTTPNTQEVWPCHQCGNPGVRNLGLEGWCPIHLGELYATFDPVVFALNGVGLQSGLHRPEYGPLYYDLTCCACGATWAGVPGESCQWCDRQYELMLKYQAEIDKQRAAP